MLQNGHLTYIATYSSPKSDFEVLMRKRHRKWSSQGVKLFTFPPPSPNSAWSQSHRAICRILQIPITIILPLYQYHTKLKLTLTKVSATARFKNAKQRKLRAGMSKMPTYRSHQPCHWVSLPEPGILWGREIFVLDEEREKLRKKRKTGEIKRT
jgi:hypothetical protein